MFTHRFRIARLLAVLSLSFVVVSICRAQDPAKVAADIYKVALDNDNVRVISVTIPAKGKAAVHSHPDHLVYAITGGKMKFTYPDGKSKDIEMKAGEAMFVKGETHQWENIGGETKVVMFELKKPAGSAAKAPAGNDQMKAAADSSKMVFENDRVRLIEASLKPGGKQAMHTHPAYVTYSLGDAKAKVTVGDKTEERTFKAGEAKWHEPTTHAVENVGTTETRTLVLEFK